MQIGCPKWSDAVRPDASRPVLVLSWIGRAHAEMATKLTAARQLTRYAAERYDSGERCDMEAGMAKLLACEVAMPLFFATSRSRSSKVFRSLMTTRCCKVSLFRSPGVGMFAMISGHASGP